LSVQIVREGFFVSLHCGVTLVDIQHRVGRAGTSAHTKVRRITF
jgi:hypothetical protein